MILLSSGIAVMVVTAIMFWSFLPRGGERHRFVDTEFEPYIGVAFTSAVALGLTMLLAGAINLLGTS
ncbi:MAG TPA: hypothetical protein VGQ97_05930 [Xanthobacteraceae bacterium]|jgi:hypothetical protein|nr:hypothetical protein [Xanthobacteraceae bacterium]